MVQPTSGFHVYSELNTWIDFIIIPCKSKEFNKAKEVIEKAYDDWWTLLDAEFEPIADWVSRCLTENDIEFDIYFKNEEED